MLKLCVVALALIVKGGVSQDDEEPYRGKLIGKFNSYHHQVSGEVYSVDEWTLLLVNFNYDGTGDDAFFWAGDSARPGPQGFIVPDERGKTNVLERYYNAEVILKLPEGKRVSRLKWFAVYDVGSQNAFADVFVPDGFEPPQPQRIGTLAAAARISSGPLQILDENTILIPELRFDGLGEVYWWVGVGPQPSAKGTKLPDELGYLEPIKEYKGVDITLSLGAAGVRGADWLALWDHGEGRALASVLLPKEPNVPPSRAKVHPYKSALPMCRQLHRDLQVSWEVFGNAITVQLAGMIGADEYMAFGISGSGHAPAMTGSDLFVARLDPSGRAIATDYNVTDHSACVHVLGALRGVCADTVLGGQDSVQPLYGSRDNGLTTVTARRALKPDEAMDLEYPTAGTVQIVWAVGPLDGAEPSFHRLWPRAPTGLELGAKDPQSDCVPFLTSAPVAMPRWEPAQLFDPSLRVFSFTLGPSGLRASLGGVSSPLAWYVNGQLAPDIQLRRGLVYSFKVFGGSDPHSATLYHPLIVTTEPRGGLDTLSEDTQKQVTVLAGVRPTRRGRLTPTAVGGLCVGSHGVGMDRRRDASVASFRTYNRSLVWECGQPTAGHMDIQPNASWPDLVYYHSFTHAGMGGRIFVVDRHQRKLSRGATSAAGLLGAATGFIAIAGIAAVAVCTRRL